MSICTTKLTPIESYGDWLFKRGDKFILGDDGVNGEKLRFILSTLTKKKEYIEKNHNGVVSCLNIKPNTNSSINVNLACDILGLEYSTSDENGFLMTQSIDDASFYYYEDVIHQVENIPSDLDLFVISCGSCHTLYAVLCGFERYGNKPKRIVAIGKKKPKTICYPLMERYGVEYYIRKNAQYNHFEPPIELDYRHELHAWCFLHTHIPYDKDGKNLFWITGNFNKFHQDNPSYKK